LTRVEPISFVPGPHRHAWSGPDDDLASGVSRLEIGDGLGAGRQLVRAVDDRCELAGGPRPPLSRDRVLRAAMALADDGGLEVFTMRRLGQELGIEAMSLYNHVADKDDILDGILDLVLSEVDLSPTATDWAEAMRTCAISVHEAAG